MRRSQKLLVGIVLLLGGILAALPLSPMKAYAAPSPTQQIPDGTLQGMAYFTPKMQAYDTVDPLSIDLSGSNFDSEYVAITNTGPSSSKNGVNYYTFTNNSMRISLTAVNPSACTVGMSVVVADNNLGSGTVYISPGGNAANPNSPGAGWPTCQTKYPKYYSRLQTVLNGKTFAINSPSVASPIIGPKGSDSTTPPPTTTDTVPTSQADCPSGSTYLAPGSTGNGGTTITTGTCAAAGSIPAGDGAPQPSCETEAGALGWIMCEVIDGLAKSIDTIYSNVIQPMLVTPSLSPATTSGNSLYKAWSDFRIIGDVFLLITLLIMIYGETLGGGG